MDKENSGNLDDILKLLKNTVENTENAPSDISLDDNTKDVAEPINAETLKEKLREQFMSDSGVEGEENDGGEYNIDSALISEFYEEAQNAEEIQESEEIVVEDMEEIDSSFEPDLEEPDVFSLVDEEETEVFVGAELSEQNEEEYSEPLQEFVSDEAEGIEADSEIFEAQEGEIVEIVIPWVEQIEEETAEDIPEDFGGELNEDYFDAEASENSYVCFADDAAIDEELFEQDEEFLDDEAEESYDDDEDDLPWYDDLPGTVKAEPIIEETHVIEEEPMVEEESAPEEDPEEEDQANNIILPIDIDKYEEYDEDAEYDEFPMDEDENEFLAELSEQAEAEESAEQMDIDDLLVANSEDNAENIKKPYSLFEKSEKPSSVAAADESDEDSSFYRMMIEARTERENAYGYFSSNANEESITQDEPQNEGIENIDIPEFKQNAYIAVDLSSTSVEKDESAEISKDFYGIDEHDASAEFDKKRDGMPVFDYDHEETHGETLTEADTSVFWRRAKPILMSVIALAILILELLPVLDIVPDGIFDYTSYPWTYIFIDAQLLIFASALCYKKLFDGLQKLFGSDANIYSVLSMTIIVTLLGSILSCFSANEVVPRPYNFISAAYLLVVCWLERVDKKRIEDSINILSGEAVFTLKRSQGKNSCAEKMYAGGLDPDTSILEPVEVESESFEGVFSRDKIWKNRGFSNSLVVSSVIPIIIFAIFMAMVSIVTAQGLATTVNAFVFTFVLLAPVSATVAYYLPIFISYRRLSKRGCVIAGYEGAAIVADCDAVVFGDGHLFKDCDAKEAGIKLYCDDSKTRELFECLGAVYSKLGGPMENTFSSVLGDGEHKVNMTRITRNGFEAVVDNKSNLIVGSSDYLARYGIITDRADSKESGIIYVAMNSLLSAKISVNYKTQPLFEELSAILDKYSVKSVVETYDPIVSGKYIAKCRGLTSSPISVVHKNINDYNSETKDKVVLGKAGAFVTSSRLKLVELLTFCKMITKLRKINVALVITSYSVAAAICLLLSFGGKMESVNLLWALLYQAIFVALYSLFALKILPLSFDALQKKKHLQEEMKKEKEM